MLTIVFMNGDKIIVNKEDYFWKKHDNFLSNIISDYPSTDEIIYLFEDNLSVLSIIQSLKSNKLLLMKDTTLEVMLELADKWCIESWLIDSIKLQMKVETPSYIDNVINNFKFTCSLCGEGYDIYENNFNSCKSHRQPFCTETNSYRCCGATRKEDFCRTCYHSPYCSSVNTFEDLYKLKLKIDS